MPAIFLSYRREDTPDFSDRIHDQFVRWYGQSRVFRDVNTILVGSDFVQALQNALLACRVLVVIIGPNWLHAANAQGQQRLFEPTDFVRSEIATALQHGKQVVPLLVKDARMPLPPELPPDLAALAGCTPIRIRNDPYFAPDIAQVFRRLRPFVSKGPVNPVTLLMANVALIGGISLLIMSGLNADLNNPFVLLAGVAAILMSTIVLLVLVAAASVRSWRTRRWGWLVAILVPFLLDSIGFVLQGTQAGFVVFLSGTLASIVSLIAYGFVGPQRPARYAQLPQAVFATASVPSVPSEQRG